VKLGHEIVGLVVDSRYPHFARGTRVAVAHHAPDFASHYSARGSETQDTVFKASNVEPCGFAEFIRVPAALVPHTVHAVPIHVPDLRAVFMEPLACCLRALDRVPARIGDTVLIVGTGAIGMLFVPVLGHAGAKVIACDVRPDRRELALTWGATEALDPATVDVADRCRRASTGRGADVIILTAVTALTLALALTSVRDGGWIIPFGVKPSTQLPLDFWQIYRREISLVTSYSATPDGLKQAIGLLSGRGYEFETLISHTYPLAQAQQAFDTLKDARGSKVVLTP
jgi:L-iditol 2-dehydrogenase